MYTKRETQLIQIVNEGDFDDDFRVKIHAPTTDGADTINVSKQGYNDDWRFTDVDIWVTLYYSYQWSDDGDWYQYDGCDDIKVYADGELIQCTGLDQAIREKVSEFAVSNMC